MRTKVPYASAGEIRNQACIIIEFLLIIAHRFHISRQNSSGRSKKLYTPRMSNIYIGNDSRKPAYVTMALNVATVCFNLEMRRRET